MRQTAAAIKSPVAKQHVLAMADRMEKADVITTKYANLISMLATPFMTLFLWAFYWRRPYNYFEHLVANMYFVGFTLLVYALIVKPINALGWFNPLYALMAFFLFETVYRSLAYYHFIQQYTTGGKIKAVAVSLFVVLAWVALSYVLIGNYIRNGLWGLFA